MSEFEPKPADYQSEEWSILKKALNLPSFYKHYSVFPNDPEAQMIVWERFAEALTSYNRASQNQSLRDHYKGNNNPFNTRDMLLTRLLDKSTTLGELAIGFGFTLYPPETED